MRACDHMCWLTMVAAALACTCAVQAQGPAPETEADSAKLARLEALLEAQQARIEALQQQVATQQQADVNANRIEQMKQQIREVLSEQEFRESLMPSVMQAGYDNGFFIKSSDDKFKMVFNGLIQFRWTYYHAQEKNRYLLPGTKRWDRSGFDLARVRLTLSGHAYSQDLTYLISFQQDAADAYDSVLSEAWVNYRFFDELQIKAGYFRPATTRSQLINHEYQQLVDRPVVDAVFGGGYGLGVRVWGQLFKKRLDYYLDILNSLAEGERAGLGRVITNDEVRELDNNPALVARAVWHVFGEDPEKDFITQSDLPKHVNPALDLGFHYAFNEDNIDRQTARIPFTRQTLFQEGGFGLTNTNGLQTHQIGIDAAFKWRGFSVTGEYIFRIVDVRAGGDNPPFAPLYQLTGDASTTTMHGAYVQAGYFLPIPGIEDKLEIVGRVGGLSVLNGGPEGTWEWGGGLNYYIHGQKVKLTADMAHISEAPISAPYSSVANVNDNAWIWRLQLTMAF